MTEAESERGDTLRSEVLPPARKAAVLAATTGVFGFAIGWILSLLTEQLNGTTLGALGLCLGVAMGVMVAMVGMRSPR
jgi:hypothetical protein